LGLWFVSGLAMPFVRYPSVDEAAELAVLPFVGAPPVLPDLPCDGHWEAERLPWGEGLWRCGRDGPWHGWSGAPHRLLTEAEAVAVAARFVGAGAPPPSSQQRLESPDLWTLPSSQLPHFPMLRVSFDDDRGTVLHVSLKTARVVQATDARARLLAWLGPVPHWLYAVPLRQHRDPWRWVVMGTAMLALLPILTGLLNGLRVAKNHWWRTGRLTPYRWRAWRWHHRLGLLAGGTALVWAASGLLSVNPGQWSTGLAPTAEDLKAWRGPGSLAGLQPLLPGTVPPEVRRWEIDRLGGHVIVRGRSTSVDRLLVDGVVEGRLDQAELEAALHRVVHRRTPDAAIPPAAPLGPQDPYLTLDARAPHAWTVEAAGIRWAYDLRTGRLLQAAGRSGRTERWLYQGLHCWDFHALATRPPLRRSLQLIGLLAGMTLLASGGLLLLRRSRRPERS